MLDLPVLIPGYSRHTWLSEDGEVDSIDGRQVGFKLVSSVPLVCHAPEVARRLHLEGSSANFADVLTLFAFVRPARWCVPTPKGLAAAMGLPLPITEEDEAITLWETTSALLKELSGQSQSEHDLTVDHLIIAKNAGWPFAELCLTSIGKDPAQSIPPNYSSLKVWRRLNKWDDSAPPSRMGNAAILESEAETILMAAVSEHGEHRPQQLAFAKSVVRAFAPAESEGSPSLVLAEAGTGVGKTLGYLAGALAWQKKNNGAVWLSTYTRNLQRQLDQELDKLYPNPTLKEERVVVIKGRENYLCLMNMEELVNEVVAGTSNSLLASVLVARWAAVSRAGELVGGDYAGWLREVIGLKFSQALTIRRGECWHGACPHYGACFAEKMARKAPHAEVVIANHAFVMAKTLTNGGLETPSQPTHFVFDEGHHIFDAADNAFSGCISGLEMHSLRRWVLGVERGVSLSPSGRARGLRKRLEDLADTDGDLNAAIHNLERASMTLPAQGWYGRLKSSSPKGSVEAFLCSVAKQVYAKSPISVQKAGFSLEVGVYPLDPEVLEAADELKTNIKQLLGPLDALKKLIASRLEGHEEDVVSDDPLGAFSESQRRRLGGVANSLNRRALEPLTFYLKMLESLRSGAPKEFVDWFEVTRNEGQDLDVAFFRKFIDPTKPFIDLLNNQAQGALITSATLTDQTGIKEVDWDAAEAATGSRHLSNPPTRVSISSPYDYSSQARIFVVTDLERDKPKQAASALAKLFKISGGGGLGLFTSISRLKSAHQTIAPKLESAGLPLLAQHVDAMDVSTLIDIFRADPDSCLLGTDALRDGVDVPGNALRLLVFDRVPWPRPTMAHQARRVHFGPRVYDDRLARLRLRQAFGRLIRSKADHGAFVMLDSRLPSRLETAFPSGVEVQRLSLKETLATLSSFYAENTV